MTELLLPQALLVDQDGTTVDSEPIWEEVEYRLTEELGGQLTAEIRQTLIGAPVPNAARAMIELSGTSRPQEEIEHAIIEGVACTIEERGVRWLPGVVEFIDGMAALGLPIAIVTASFHRIADAVLADCPVQGIRLLIAGDDVPAPKPEPFGYLLAAKKLGVDITQCVAIEDSFPGMTAASRSGARTIIVASERGFDPLPGVSRVRKILDITPEFLHRVMSGEVIDLYA